MQIVGDSCADMSPEQMAGLNVHIVPLTFTLDGKVYRGGVDIDTDGFYRLIAATDGFPTTSQPSVGDFAEAYRRLVAIDPEILSIHIASALSGTYNSAVAAAKLFPDARITVYDSKLVSGPLGWMLEAAGKCANAGWDVPRIVALLEDIRRGTDFVFTTPSLRYLIHGGRISHLKGLLGTALGIRPVIGVDTETGALTQAGQVRTMKAAYQALVNHMLKRHTPGTTLRVQVLHGVNPEGAATLRDLVDEHFDCKWMPTGSISPVLGAHTGPGLVGVFYGPMSVYNGIPGGT